MVVGELWVIRFFRLGCGPLWLATWPSGWILLLLGPVSVGIALAWLVSGWQAGRVRRQPEYLAG